MQTSIKKILLIAAALVFIATGVSFAQSRNPGHSGNNSRGRSGNISRGYAGNNSRGHAGNISRGHVAGRFHKRSAYRAPNFRNRHYAYRNPGHAARPYYGKRYYPRKSYRHYNNYRYHRSYPSHNNFFFGFTMR